MHEAIQNNNLYQMESINKQLMDIHLNQVLKVADRKTRFELKIKVCSYIVIYLQKNKDRHKPMLNWKFIIIFSYDIQIYKERTLGTQK